MHADKKWFFLQLHLSLELMKLFCIEPARTMKKAMFLTARSRKASIQWLTHNDICTFDGMIGVFLFINNFPTQCAGGHHPNGAIVSSFPIPG